ncbi:NAD-dependent epimerase/dehydratase family protein [Pedobacter arcticus]|uniref:NAD-dependent epimerase/dehydratase family protein n=1 Tax=Pedobacter arcticus TaxID=752140 RepID=UPI0002E58628|nr:NAD-dependent epimerase/dehydratase family protein [Pedobacter arcticus]
MKIIITGATGFLGRTILFSFKSQEVITVGRQKSNICCDLSSQIPKIPLASLIVHVAGKAHSVPKTEKEKQHFFDVNVTGTQNLLKGLEQSPSLPKSFVFISSVSVYGLDKGENIKESDPLNAKDAYGLSKIQAEKIIQNWCDKNKVICTVLRLPLLVGDNPPGNLGAMIKAINKGYYFNIAGGQARKSMVLAMDVAEFILPASEIGGVYNLTDGYHPSFKELSDSIADKLQKNSSLNVPSWLANLMARVGDMLGEKSPFNSYKLSKISSSLTFDDTKAREALGWHPKKVLEYFAAGGNNLNPTKNKTNPR